MTNTNIQDIAVFRNRITQDLQVATGFLYYLNGKLNDEFKKIEGLKSTPSNYCVLIINRPEPPAPTGEVTMQRNIYFNYDIDNNVFHMQPTGKVDEDEDGVVLAEEFDVYFLPDGKFITVNGDYLTIEKFLKGGGILDGVLRYNGPDLANFINYNGGQDFVATNSHTKYIRR